MYTLLLIFVTIIWGSTFVILKDLVQSVDPFFIVFARMALAATALSLTILIHKNRKQILNFKAIKNGSILGAFLGTALATQTIGLKFTTAGHSGFITGTEVILIPILLYIFFKRKIQKIDILAVTIVLIGLFLLTYNLNEAINIGDLITLITAISAAFLIIFTSKFVKTTPILPLVFYQFLSASIITLIVFLLSNQPLPAFTTKSIFSIAYLGLVANFLAYLIVAKAQKHIPPVTVGLIFTLQAVIAAIFGYFVFQEVMTPKELLGAGLILSGIVLHKVKNTSSKKV